MKTVFLYGALVLVFGVSVYVITTQGTSEQEQGHDHASHPHPEDVHVHADFKMILNDTEIDLTQEKYQSGLESGVQHADVHLHDNQGNIIHRHANGITFQTFLESIGFLLTENCITTDTGEQYCMTNQQALLLYVNGTPRDSIADYILDDEDQVLLYYGPQDNPRLQSYLASVSDEACIYSGTCPERGTPPPEACGLTCEVAPEDL